MPGRMDGYQKDTFLSHARNIGADWFIASISILGPKKASSGPLKRHMKWGHLGPQFTVTFIWNFWKIPNEVSLFFSRNFRFNWWSTCRFFQVHRPRLQVRPDFWMLDLENPQSWQKLLDFDRPGWWELWEINMWWFRCGSRGFLVLWLVMTDSLRTWTWPSRNSGFSHWKWWIFP